MSDAIVGVLGAIGVAAFGVTVVVGAVTQRNRRTALWDGLCQTFGLHRAYPSAWRGEVLAGEIEGVPVEIRVVARNKVSFTVLAVGGGNARVDGLTMRPEAEGALSGFFQGSDLETGDPDFDRVVFVGRASAPPGLAPADDAELRARLDADVRARLSRLVTEDRAVLDAEGLHLELHGACPEAATVHARLRALVAAFRALEAACQRAREPVAALARLATEDPLAGVRTAAFMALARGYPDAPATRAAAEITPEFRTPNVEFVRLRVCGDAAAAPGLRELADADQPMGIRGAALRELVRRFGYAAEQPRVLACLGARMPADRAAALDLIVEAADAAQAPRLAALMLREPAESAARFARALGALGDTCAEPDLLRLLARDEVGPDTQTTPEERHALTLALCEALGALGTVSAVEPLLPLTEGLLREGSVKAAAREAVRRIQARLGPAESGLVSLAESDTSGRVSFE